MSKKHVTDMCNMFSTEKSHNSFIRNFLLAYCHLGPLHNISDS